MRDQICNAILAQGKVLEAQQEELSNNNALIANFMIGKIPNIEKYEKTAIVAYFHDAPNQISVSTSIANYLKNQTKNNFPAAFMKAVTSNS